MIQMDLRAVSLGSFAARRIETSQLQQEEDDFMYWAFQCNTITNAGSNVSLRLDLTEDRVVSKAGGLGFQMEATDGPDIISRKRVSTGGVSFVWLPGQREVRDVRVYVNKEHHRKGYGTLIVSFVKAFFLIHHTDSMPDGDFAIPLGGYRGITALTVLPVTGPAQRFYRTLGFAPDNAKLRNKWLFSPEADPTAFLLQPRSLDHKAVLATLFALPHASWPRPS
jgi:GNAT superfamily N-acetyltransferase